MRLIARSNKRGLAPLVAAFAYLLVATVAHSQSGAQTGAREATPDAADALRGWSPFTAVEIGVHVQEFTAAGATSFGAVNTGTDTQSALMFRAEAGVASPPVRAIPGRPRFAIRGGVSTPLRETTTVTSSQQIVDEIELGSEFFVSWKTMWHAGVDLRFDFEIADQDVSIQPGLEYLGSRIRYEPEFTFRPQPGSEAAQMTPNPFNPPRIGFSGRSSPHTYHFVGPSLAIEVAVTRVKWISISAFLNSRMYWLVGDRDVEVEFSKDLLGNPESGAGRLESNFIAGQVGFGLRGRF